ncbi:hypothetical protein [Zarconia navalis]|uniref:hypothetical protein n=1 Tax=Zarconia navalis TaxID=2992134 RepID=UPI0029C9AD22|nr:hypothetical protein [Zarconia navalis]
MKDIDPFVLRQLWSTIENTQSRTLTSLDDASLVDRLIGDFGQQRSLNEPDRESICAYLKSRISLIRDIACTRPGIPFLGSSSVSNSRQKRESNR